MIIDGSKCTTSPQALKELNAFIQKNHSHQYAAISSFPSYWSDLFWFTQIPEDDRIPQLVSFIQVSKHTKKYKQQAKKSHRE